MHPTAYIGNGQITNYDELYNQEPHDKNYEIHKKRKTLNATTHDKTSSMGSSVKQVFFLVCFINETSRRDLIKV